MEEREDTNLNSLINNLSQDLVELNTSLSEVKTIQELEGISGFGKTATELQKITAEFQEKLSEDRKQRENEIKERAHILCQVLVQRQKRITAYVKRELSQTPKKEGVFVVVGQVVDQKTGLGLPNVLVRAWDLDLDLKKPDDPLGSIRTDALGYYRIEYTEEDFDDYDKKPELYIEVFGEDGSKLYTSRKSFMCKAGELEIIDARVDGSKFPTAYALALGIARAVNNQIEALDLRKQILSNRKRATGLG